MTTFKDGEYLVHMKNTELEGLTKENNDLSDLLSEIMIEYMKLSEQDKITSQLHPRRSGVISDDQNTKWRVELARSVVKRKKFLSFMETLRERLNV